MKKITYNTVSDSITTSCLIEINSDEALQKNLEFLRGEDSVPNDSIVVEEIPPTIEELKSKLDGTDYKIIKCSECQLAGLEFPYDIQILHNQRQQLRDQINELE